jgi:large subunit ribosomal protein L10e
MGLRPARCYRNKERPFTRQSRKKPRKGYVKGVPMAKIRKFELGNPKADFEKSFYLVSSEVVQIRHNALEAARVILHKSLEKEVGKGIYFAKILVYPHHVLRENLLATGAGADRFQTGMRKAYGKVVSTAAQVKSGQRILMVRVNQGKETGAKAAIKAAASKLPLRFTIVAG